MGVRIDQRTSQVQSRLINLGSVAVFVRHSDNKENVENVEISIF